MNAVDLIKSKLNILKLLENLGFEPNYTGQNIVRCVCKIHNGKNPNSFVINLENGLYICYSCFSKGDIIKLVMEIKQITFIEAIRFLADFAKVDIKNADICWEEDSFTEDELKKFIKAIKNTNKKNNFTRYGLPETKAISKFRSFKKETMEHFGVKYAEVVEFIGKKKKLVSFRKRIIVPITQKNVLIGFASRRTLDDNSPKWLNTPPHLPLASTLYNYESVIGEKEVAVVEGFFDVMALYEIGVPAVATYGAKISEEQYRLLFKLGCDIIDGYDEDSAGKKASVKLQGLFKNKATIRKIPLEDGEDVESINRNELKQAYERRYVVMITIILKDETYLVESYNIHLGENEAELWITRGNGKTKIIKRGSKHEIESIKRRIDKAIINGDKTIEVN